MSKKIPFPLVSNCKPDSNLFHLTTRYENHPFCKNIAETFEDDDLNDIPLYDAAFRRAVPEWVTRPKIADLTSEDGNTKMRIDWAAHETAFGLLPAPAYDERTRGHVLVLLGPGRVGKTVSARWIQDSRALLECEIVPAWVTSAEFADYGAYKNKAIKLVDVLRGVRKQYNPKKEESYELSDTRCISVIDGICGDKLSACETFALLSAIEGATDRSEFDLILTTPQNSRESFSDQLAVGEAGIGIVNRLNECGDFVAYKSDRAGICPWVTTDYEVREPYALPEKPQT